ncbi:ATP-grasp domain-containing protein [Acinetobacter lwoffii]|uniref:ATP-grasp domain-containing protein n=1 Tax=Acinetobacter lwoffii TaxID=28090 RepID=UPI0021CD5A11|nr:ATP-grasp domain-containing protein [Acinetobacter lwoffii]MCU4449602.1 ATP-grasp domain-containing protein [Acinetobacter lwoffii]
MNILFCSVGRRATLLRNFKSKYPHVNIYATDNSEYAPALHFADKKIIAPRVDSPGYIDFLLDICKRENIKAITTLIDPEIEIISRNRDVFTNHNILPLVPDYKTATLCFDKFEMYKYLKSNGINTISTYDCIDLFEKDLKLNKINFPVFIKPKTGSASVGAEKIEDLITLKSKFLERKHEYIIQEYMDGDDIDADVYVDCLSHEVVSIFSKKKLETKIGGASKTISFKDHTLFELVKNILSNFKFYGPLDMDFFYKNGKYYLSEINPRFGGAYLHAFGAGVDFYKLILNNMNGEKSLESIGNYENDILMMMYDDVVIKKLSEL